MKTEAIAREFALPGLWPSPDQLLVLRAALCEPHAARQAFDEWVQKIDIQQDFDQGTFRLLPLLYHNLHNAGVEHPLMGRLKGVYRLAWYKNHKLLDRMRPVVQGLQQAGIPTMLLKGVPLVMQYYGNHALRPMADVDVLVPANAVRPAMAVFEAFGLRPYAPPSDDCVRFRHALSYDSSDGFEIDLHWHALYEFCDQGADAVFWDSARALNFDGVPTTAPDATRMLFHTVVHGVRWNEEPPIRWIPDTMAILRAGPDEIQWDELIALARERQVTYRVRIGLGYLHRYLEAPIPLAVLAKLAQLPTTWVQRVENTCVLHDRRSLYGRPFSHLWLIFAEYCRYARTARPATFVSGFPHYLRFRLGLRGRSEIAAVFWRGTLKRLVPARFRAARLPAEAE